MRFGTVCIIGPGLIGGSVGLGLKKRNLAKTVIGVGHRTSSLEKAIKMHAIDIGILNDEEAVKDADIVILATSVNKIIDTAKKIIPIMKNNAILTDVGSTKKYIVEQISHNLRKDITFVGAHPIAGSEQRGVAFASPDLFEDCTCIITPIGNHTKEVETISQLWRLLGAKIKYLTPEQHDEILASVSHLPHLAASCLINAFKKEHLVCGASGLRDITRIASGDPELWMQIFDQNRENIIKSIDLFIAELGGFRNDLLNKNNAKILDRLKNAKLSRDSVFHNNSTNKNTNK
ncbi:MAG TPA: prephenate dehydrogenase [Candidatus Wunengus californicus]|uniref:prephenate dehydrogenase n=1 Tax=Candidatus Wunengus californicus TaxID=3367619 RepID=UPI00402A0568|nr:prephenate dehydrogenase [Planctomycetota bacterium]